MVGERVAGDAQVEEEADEGAKRVGETGDKNDGERGEEENREVITGGDVGDCGVDGGEEDSVGDVREWVEAGELGAEWVWVDWSTIDGLLRGRSEIILVLSVLLCLNEGDFEISTPNQTIQDGCKK